jgi:hypothetical protein
MLLCPRFDGEWLRLSICCGIVGIVDALVLVTVVVGIEKMIKPRREAWR